MIPFLEIKVNTDRHPPQTMDEVLHIFKYYLQLMELQCILIFLICAFVFFPKFSVKHM